MEMVSIAVPAVVPLGSAGAVSDGGTDGFGTWLAGGGVGACDDAGGFGACDDGGVAEPSGEEGSDADGPEPPGTPQAETANVRMAAVAKPRTSARDALSMTTSL